MSRPMKWLCTQRPSAQLLFIAIDAISKGIVSFSIMEQYPKSDFNVDLHGMNRDIVTSAVRVPLQHFIQSKKNGKIERDVLIVIEKASN